MNELKQVLQKPGTIKPIPLKKVSVNNGFWGSKLKAIRVNTLPHVYKKLKEAGCIAALKLRESDDIKNKYAFRDSDLAKWMEGAAYSLTSYPDKNLENQMDNLIDMMESAQMDDGYLNTYYQIVGLKKRWTNLAWNHELYCAGHLIESAIAYFEATGKRKFLDVMCRYADYIDTVFGPENGKKKGYPGHEEIELALVKLFKVTRENKYLKLAEFFINERGRRPLYFKVEAEKRGEVLNTRKHGDKDEGRYMQAHIPVREQKTAEGHAVRGLYLYNGMTEVAMHNGDKSLMDACRNIWENVVTKRMYITGGAGSSKQGERFTFDYDLPNETSYSETCAAIALAMWSSRLLQKFKDGKYADIMEKAIYNGILSGLSLEGTNFFYMNPLAVYPDAYKNTYIGKYGANKAERREWYGVACCPTNLSRFLPSIGKYIYSESKSELYVHLYVNSEVDTVLDGNSVRLKQESNYPWDGKIKLFMDSPTESEFTLALRKPGWCSNVSIKVNGEKTDDASIVYNGYIKIKRKWSKHNVIDMEMDMPVEIVEAHPAVRMNCGCIALQRGPLVYCLEETDNGKYLNDIYINRDQDFKVDFKKDLLGGVCTITGTGYRRKLNDWEGFLYKRGRSDTEQTIFTAVPYYAWCNRGSGEMLVWIHSNTTAKDT